MGLEIPTGKVPGTVVRATPAERPAFAGLLILALTAIEFVFVILVFWAVANDANNAAALDPAIPQVSFDIPPGPDQVVPPFYTVPFFLNEQTLISFWLACIFFCLFMIILLYQRFFLDHVTIAKKRFRKWEDEGVQLHD